MKETFRADGEARYQCPLDGRIRYKSAGDLDILAVVADADALAAALAEVERLRTALGEIGASINFSYDAIEGDGDSKVERMLVRIGRMTEDALGPVESSKESNQ